MQPTTGAYGDGLAKYFRADASSHLVISALRKSKLAVTRIRRDAPGHGMTSPLPAESAFSVLLQLRDSPKRELFIGGRSVYRGGYGARTTSIVDLEQEPTANLQSPFDVLHFYVSRTALDEITDEHGAPRIATLSCERGAFDATVWHLGQALLPALERPEQMGEMYADHLMLATHTYFAIAFGGMRLPEYGRRGALAPWQVRCATELMIERMGEDISLSEPAAACGLSSNYFARAFKRSMGMPPHRWMLLQRVLRAKSLLRDADRSLSDIAAACGFADQSHFTRVFTGIVGASPGAWRKQVL
ncbi:AraC family transcriptional regulator [Pseudoxanthomonas sp. CF125]|uniref:helix-turn-helix domain-containing protein n=1 Tax=Pseudoxanthomonas sp. CF125 TaxID=1855303 RepID=UPI0008800F93|nr:AraC family transcriptional regulator [Pseudoxanthomonas sp. CF125]SDQ84439.1 AraC-type DNA-binding protein [Pseudoxanthomonas sp. CF125]